jgi:hypothetical protein
MKVTGTMTTNAITTITPIIRGDQKPLFCGAGVLMGYKVWCGVTTGVEVEDVLEEVAVGLGDALVDVGVGEGDTLGEVTVNTVAAEPPW